MLAILLSLIASSNGFIAEIFHYVAKSGGMGLFVWVCGIY